MCFCPNTCKRERYIDTWIFMSSNKLKGNCNLLFFSFASKPRPHNFLWLVYHRFVYRSSVSLVVISIRGLSYSKKQCSNVCNAPSRLAASYLNTITYLSIYYYKLFISYVHYSGYYCVCNYNLAYELWLYFCIRP